MRPAYPLWLWPNVLSLDAPLIAVAWQALLAETSGTPLRPVGRVILFLTVWLIYVVDRLLDARRPAAGQEPERHQFYRRHQWAMGVAAAVVLVVDAALILLELHPAVFRTGLMTFFAVCVYLGLVHGTRLAFSKETAVAVLFTMGTFLVAFTRSSSPLRLLPAAVAFFLLCLANLVAIEHWESASPLLLGRWFLVWVPMLAVLTPFVVPGRWSWAVALSAAALAALHGGRSQIGLAPRRALADAVLLVPALSLL